MTEKTGFKYSIGFGQSMTSGVLAFHGEYHFDDPTEFNLQNAKLLTMLKNQEEVFTNAGYKVASIIPNNMKQLPNTKKEKEEEEKETK